MKARATEVKPIKSTLIVDVLELLDKHSEICVSFTELFASNAALGNDADSMHKLAEVFPIFLQKDNSEESWSKSK